MGDGVRRLLVDVADWNPSHNSFSSLLSILPLSDHLAVTKFLKLEDRKRALVSRLLQFCLVHQVMGIPFDEIIIDRTSKGKPYLRNTERSPFPNFNFSVSHDGSYVGIASEPLCLVGLDIVSIPILEQETSLEFVNKFSSYFTTFEWRQIVTAGNNDDDILAEFFRYWSLKEAYVKAIGVGVGYGLHRLEFHHTNWTNIYVYIDGIRSRKWMFEISALDKRHLASIARGLHATTAEGHVNIRENAVIEDDKEYLGSVLLPYPGFSFYSVEELISAVYDRALSRLSFPDKKTDEALRSTNM